MGTERGIVYKCSITKMGLDGDTIDLGKGKIDSIHAIYEKREGFA